MEETNGTVSPEKLLHYCATHQVLICTACRYAVQPAAIPRHLKDIHHIQSNQRRPFIAYANTLKLKKPEEVEPPRPGQFPLRYLPLEQGWRCEAPGCDYLCASIKRMETHWAAKHGRKGYSNSDWSYAPLQSFFRGNMLRYFTSSTRPVKNVATALYENQHMKRIKEKYNLDSMDSEILDHYFSSFYKSFVTNDQTERIWVDVVPGLAYDISFLLQGILACTALHMAYLTPEMRQEYTLRAYYHQDTAIPQFRHAINYPDEQNCDAIMSFAYILVIYSLATDTESSKNPLLIVEDEIVDGEMNLILPQWLHFIRAGCSMLCEVWDIIENGPASALAYTWESQLKDQEIEAGDLPYLPYFKSLVPSDGSWSEESIRIYHVTATALAESFAYLESAKGNYQVNPWNILGVWPVRVEMAFFSLISEKHPGALIILAYYCIILKDMEKLWYFEGRPAKLLVSIEDVLDTRWHSRIQEPIKIVTGSK
ncbi:Cutinase [Penicillium atrosanguineum]|uniref:Cutinase n=1 Tax=Penicillium atrosanguineum TaxID=1132637 RepID=UPI00239B8D0D|nr:Cutinase [Penicillium atrosanguineum]KAJ5314127.1 Cutinase [Penicillium atrosanguineum]